MRDFPSGDHSGSNHGRGKRYFGRGGVKIAVLELLAKEPMHGYQIMKQLEEKSGGLYIPSAGSIYPVLQMLEDRGLITSQEEAGGKKVYTMTENGRTARSELPEHECNLGHGRRHSQDADDEAYRHERIRRKLGLSEDTYPIIRQLMAAEKWAEGNPANAEQLNHIVALMSKQLDAFLNSKSVPEEKQSDHHNNK